MSSLQLLTFYRIKAGVIAGFFVEKL